MTNYRSILTEGLPPGNMVKALMLTDAGVQGSGKRWFGRTGYDETRAADVFRQTLGNSARKPFSALKNPYVQLARKQIYASNAPGLGADDYDADMAETIVGYDAKVIATAPALAPPPTGGSSSGWSDVLQSTTKTLASGISIGLSNLIGGRPPAPTVVAAPSSGPSLGSIALIAGAVGIPLYLLFRRK